MQICTHFAICILPAIMAQCRQWSNTLSCSAEGLAGWLARRHGFNSRCGHVEFMSGFLHVMRLNSGTGIQGPPLSSIKCDRPSLPDWLRRLGCDESRLHG